MTGEETTVLLVEDSDPDALYIQELFTELDRPTGRVRATQAEWTLTRVDSLADCLDTLDSASIDLVLLDLNLPDSHGVETVDTVLEAATDTPIVVLTGLDDERAGVEAIERGVQDYLNKDEVTPTLLGRTIQYALERHDREQRLTDREATLRELHTTTDQLLQAQTETEVADYILACGSSLLAFSHNDVVRFDDSEGRLRVVDLSSTRPMIFASDTTFGPDDGLLWEAYRRGETTRVPAADVEAALGESADGVDELVAIPIGEFGLYVGAIEGAVDAFDIELAELLASHAQAAVERLQKEQALGRVSEQLTEQETRLDELEALTETVHHIQHRIANSETRESLEAAVCAELVSTGRVDFAWIARPKTTDDDLTTAALAGADQGYLDTALSDGTAPPAVRAATRRQTVTVSSIASRVQREPWAKEALSCGFRSAISIPLLYDEVLYGVLTAYSSRETAFDGVFEQVFTEVGSLLANSISIRERRQFEHSNRVLELEFELTEPGGVFHSLAAATDCTLSFDTTVETDERVTGVLVTVLSGDPAAVLDSAGQVRDIAASDWFGDAGGRQLRLDIHTPFLGTYVRNHGGRLTGVVADGNTTVVTVELPANVAARPLMDALTTRYTPIELLARREKVRSQLSDSSELREHLTGRQFEILRTAYYGGYFESPKRISGEDIASSFDISAAVVYNHLRAAERALLERVFEMPSNDIDVAETAEQSPLDPTDPGEQPDDSISDNRFLDY